MKNEQNAPKIRFKGFTDAWEQRELKELASFAKGSGYSKTDIKAEGTPIILYGRLYTKYETTINDVDTFAETKKGSIYSKGSEVIVPASGETAEDIARASFVSKPGILLGGDLNIIYPNSAIEPTFLALSISNGEQQKSLAKKAQGKSVVHLHNSDLETVQITYPTRQEQTKIGQYFESIDHLITLHQRKCETLQKLKKSMLQKMFPKNGSYFPEIRFAGFTDAWEQRKLGELGKATGGTSIESEFSENGIYKVISIGSYSEDSIYRDQGIRAILSEKTKERILNKGDITMILNDKTSSGNIIGRVLLIEESGIYVYNQRTERVEIDSTKYDSQFIYTMLNAPEIRDKIVKQSQGNTQIYVNWSVISKTVYLLPNIEEQHAIGTYFRTLDHLITLHQRKLETLKKLKKAMLQKMFPPAGRAGI